MTVDAEAIVQQCIARANERSSHASSLAAQVQAQAETIDSLRAQLEQRQSALDTAAAREARLHENLTALAARVALRDEPTEPPPRLVYRFDALEEAKMLAAVQANIADSLRAALEADAHLLAAELRACERQVHEMSDTIQALQTALDLALMEKKVLRESEESLKATSKRLRMHVPKVLLEALERNALESDGEPGGRSGVGPAAGFGWYESR